VLPVPLAKRLHEAAFFQENADEGAVDQCNDPAHRAFPDLFQAPDDLARIDVRACPAGAICAKLGTVRRRLATPSTAPAASITILDASMGSAWEQAWEPAWKPAISLFSRPTDAAGSAPIALL